MEYTASGRRTSHALMFVFAVIFFVFSVSSLSFGMKIDEHGNMQKCPFVSEESTVCSMDVLKHMMLWKQVFSTAYLKLDDVVLILLLSVVLTFFVLRMRLHNTHFFKKTSFFFQKNKPEVTLFNYLVRAFFAGILHPKIYNSSIL